MKKRDNTYKNFQRYVKDKDRAVITHIDNTLNKTQSMFVYSGQCVGPAAGGLRQPVEKRLRRGRLGGLQVQVRDDIDRLPVRGYAQIWYLGCAFFW